MNTITTDDGEYVGPLEFAKAIGVVEKTVRRRLKAGAVDGAWQDGLTGRWFIPVARIADALAEADVPLDVDEDVETPTTAVATRPPRVVRMHVDEAPAPVPAVVRSPLGDLYSLEAAAGALGTTEGGVRRMVEAGLYVEGPFLGNGKRAIYIPAKDAR